LLGMAAAWGIGQAPRLPREARKFSWGEVRAAAWEAKWELMIPVIACAGLFGGWATPVEAAALTAFSAWVVEAVVFRDIAPWKGTRRVMTQCGLMVGAVLLILGQALAFTDYLVIAEVPARAAEWVAGAIQSPLAFLLLLNIFLIAAGALMDIYSAIFVVVPLILPMAAHFHIDPVHLGIIFLVNAELGYLMPPVGENLFLAALRFQKSVAEVFRAVIPMMVIFLIAVILITYFPALSLTLPKLLLH